jgi:hypothetical protein
LNWFACRANTLRLGVRKNYGKSALKEKPDFLACCAGKKNTDLSQKKSEKMKKYLQGFLEIPKLILGKKK